MTSGSANRFTVMLVAAAAVAWGLAGLKHLRGAPDPRPPTGTPLDGWEALLAHGIVGSEPSADSSVVVIEFFDFECPFCAKAADSLRILLGAFPRQIRLLHRHFPLDSIHPHASEAAVAAECANRAGRFAQFRELVFARQGEIGITPWPSFARLAGIGDTALFVRCLDDPTAHDAVRVDYTAGTQAGVFATPTFIVDGRMFVGLGGITALRARLDGLD